MRNTNFILFQVLLCQFCIGLSASTQPDSVQQTFDHTALDSFKRVNDIENYFTSLSDIAIHHMRKGSSIDLLELGDAYNWRPENASAEDSLQIRYSMTSMAFMYMKRYGDYNKALTYFEKAYDYLTDKGGGDMYSWFIENRIASIYTRLGNFEKAVFYYSICENYFIAKKDFKELSRLYTNLGRLYRSWSRPTKAIYYFNKGLEFVRLEDKGYISNHSNLVELYLDMGYLAKAEEHIKLAYASPFRSDAERQLQLLETEADLAFMNGSHRKAKSLYLKAETIFIEINENIYRREFAKLCNKLARNSIELKDYDDAASSLALGFHSLNRGSDSTELSIPDKRELYDENSYIELLMTMSQLVSKRNAVHDEMVLDSLININGLGMYVNELLRKRYVMTGSQLYAVNFNRKFLDVLIDSYYKKKSDSGADLDEVANLFVRSKAVLLDEEKRFKACFSGLPDSLFFQYKVLQDSVFNLQRRISFEASDSLRLLFENEMFLLREQLDEMADCEFDNDDEKISGHYIDYYVGADYVYSFSHTNAGLRFLRHGSTDSLYKMIDRYNAYVSNIFSTNVNITCELNQLLLAPLDDELGERLSIIPDGVLHTVPFESLACETDVMGINRYCISYKYNTYDEMNEKEGSAINLSYMLPSYGSDDERVPMADLGRGSIYKLPNASKEIDNIISSVSEQIYEIRDLEAYFMDGEADTYNVLHYAGHAIADGDEAYLQYGINDDERIYHEQIEVLNFDLDLVVLSACETGLGVLERGEGVMSLGRSFLSAGADAVVYSLWNANDSSTSELVSYFYEYLQSGASKSEALRSAKLKYLNSVPREKRHPYYWAGFVVVGDDSPVIGNTSYRWVMYLALIAMIVLLIIKSTKRK